MVWPPPVALPTTSHVAWKRAPARWQLTSQSWFDILLTITQSLFHPLSAGILNELALHVCTPDR